MSNFANWDVKTGRALKTTISIDVDGYSLTGASVELRIDPRERGSDSLILTDAEPEITVAGSTITIEVGPSTVGNGTAGIDALEYADLRSDVDHLYHIDVIKGGQREWRLQGRWRIVHEVGPVPAAAQATAVQVSVSDQVNLSVDTHIGETLAKALTFKPQEITGDGTTEIDWGNGNKVNLDFGAQSEALTFVDPPGACDLTLKLTQDGGGSRVISSWPAAVVAWEGGSAPVLQTAPGAVDIVSFYFDGSGYYGSHESFS